MKKYIITYDLLPEGQNYDGLISAINQYESIKGLLSVYFIKTEHNTEEIYDYLSQFIDSNDRIFISEISESYIGYLDNKIWDFLKN